MAMPRQCPKSGLWAIFPGGWGVDMVNPLQRNLGRFNASGPSFPRRGPPLVSRAPCPSPVVAILPIIPGRFMPDDIAPEHIPFLAPYYPGRDLSWIYLPPSRLRVCGILSWIAPPHFSPSEWPSASTFSFFSLPFSQDICNRGIKKKINKKERETCKGDNSRGF